jgi:hypothetical protein
MDAMFLDDIAASHTIVTGRKKAISAKDGQIVLEGKLTHFLEATGTGQAVRNVPRDTVPPYYTKPTRDGKKTYPGPIRMQVSLTHLSSEEDKCIKRVDPVTGTVEYSVRVSLNYFKEASDFLESKREFIWSHEDPDSLYLRDYINADGTSPSSKWMTFTEGTAIQITTPDSKGNVFRELIPNTSTAMVQLGAPLRFVNVEAEAHIGMREEEQEIEGQLDAEGKPMRHKVKRLSPHFKFNCKTKAALCEDYDPLLCYTERLHETEPKDRHNLAPIADFRKNQSCIPSTAYFYLAPWYMTKWSPAQVDPTLQGVTLVREKESTPENFHRVKHDESEVTAMKFGFTLYQWTGRPHKDEKYDVQVIDTDKRMTNWLSFGITDKHEYANILSTNLDLPIHLTANLWAGSVLQNDANDLDKINNRGEVANMRGYYTYGVTKATPDYLRYFKTRGLRLSPNRVEHEFRGAISFNSSGTKRMQLTPLDQRVNPINIGGLSGAMLSLGNGKMEVGASGEEFSLNHAWKGNLLLLLEANEHDFYVLMSKQVPESERAQYAGPDGEYADALLDERDKDLSYWIFAVRKDAKMGASFVPPKPKKEEEEEVKVKAPPSPPKGKRGRDESEGDPMDSPPTQKLASSQEEDEE